MRTDIISYGHKVISSFCFDNNMIAANKMSVVVIVPTGYCIDHFITLITNSTKYRIDERPAAGSYQYFAGTIIQFFRILYKRKNGFPEVKITFCGRIVSKMPA